MPRLVERVATRYLRDVSAAFVPARWFKTKTSELKAILKTSFGDSMAPRWSERLDSDVLPFVNAFAKDIERVVPYHATTAAWEPIKAVKKQIEHARIDWETLEYARQRFFFNPRTPEEGLRHGMGWACFKHLTEATSTIADLFKVKWTVQENVLDRLVAKALASAEPSELEAFSRGTVPPRIQSAALKALKKDKRTWSPTSWIGEIYQALVAEFDKPEERQFDFNGMKVVIANPLATDAEVMKFIGYLEEAYRLLAKKGLKVAWYGEIYLDCKDCGDGAGGHFRVGPNTISVFDRLNSRTSYVIIHELGHRYWFKHMSGEQRSRFSGLIRTHTAEMPDGAPRFLKVLRFSERDVALAHRQVEKSRRRALEHLGAIESMTSDRQRAARAFKSTTVDITTQIHAFTRLVDDSLMFHETVFPSLNEAALAYATRREIADLVETISQVDDHQVSSWVKSAEGLLNKLVQQADAYFDNAAKVYNQLADDKVQSIPGGKDWLDSYLNNPNPVPAVSAYGKTNIDEAFAEVFAHYVTGEDITRDQLESFRSVLKRASKSTSAVVRL